MRKGTRVALVLLIALVIDSPAIVPRGYAQDMKPLRVVSETTVKGFAFPESVAYDPQAKVLYVSEFGSELKPAQKDGKGRISRVSLTGEVLDRQFLPAPGGQALNKPKGIWVEGNRLWVTDIDAVWVFDLKTRRGKKVALPGAQLFANDPTVLNKALYVSDNSWDQLFRIEPADFLEMAGSPKVTRVFHGKSVNPNGLYPAKDGSLLMVGFMSAERPRGIYSLSAGGDITTLAKEVGRLDGLYQMEDGTLLVTDWGSGALLQWTPTATVALAKGFKGPADFCVVPEANGLLVIVPDLVQGELRLVRLSR